MQTFLPYPSFRLSAQLLDDSRLPNQANEAAALYRANTEGAGYRWHPAARMWRGFEDALLLYRCAMIGECARRGIEREFKVLDGEEALYERLELHSARDWRSWQQVRTDQLSIVGAPPPPWLGWEPFHRAHRANLAEKDPAHYAEEWADDAMAGLYYWPVPDHAYVRYLRSARTVKTARARDKHLERALHAFREVCRVGSTVEYWEDDALSGAGEIRVVAAMPTSTERLQVHLDDGDGDQLVVPVARVRVLSHGLDLDALSPR